MPVFNHAWGAIYFNGKHKKQPYKTDEKFCSKVFSLQKSLMQTFLSK